MNRDVDICETVLVEQIFALSTAETRQMRNGSAPQSLARLALSRLKHSLDTQLANIDAAGSSEERREYNAEPLVRCVHDSIRLSRADGGLSANGVKRRVWPFVVRADVYRARDILVRGYDIRDLILC